MDDNVRGGDADATSTERVLKRKVKNSRTNLFEWVKYRCHLGDGFFLCECPTSFDNETVSLQVLLANILSVHPKAASRFEITHATPSGHSSDEFMAPTSQHCSLWVRTLKKAVAQSMQLDSISPTPLDLLSSLRPPHSFQTNTTAHPKQSLKIDIPCRNSSNNAMDATKLSTESPSIPTPRCHPDDTPSSAPDIQTSPPSLTHPSLASAMHEPDKDSSPPDASSPVLVHRSAVSQQTPSEHEAEEQLGILVRVEGVLKQLETENKLYLQRETQLRHELANLQDSMRLMDVERQELLTQLRDVTTEREEWKAMARRKQADMTQLRDDLQLARDEIRLLTNEQLRLHHRNKDLAVHVQRLDTLVYGKF
ncbi:hypothetical protein DYB28_000492 [Aphanomyces astaci]|uniref:PH domain-containing protein n=1 Tax=Aphanomyces astaci TaxID=112090 RepID=A0A397B7T5_APHAT|nr:hypothetical protein DYB36_012418 [Aphanomyces astaci]RHY59621.1 hypothetical protein DYB34_011752 [Aphanomyces astaci]RHZ39114.1 hypothetical protein DYB26_003206 [Aphanomyces astaci]RLO00233.1 hypothetical protein DYB28_000726 [Aphanomyces astaci]RLO05227.1 hypothetical protein DYB28_000492 [Aphanomyces astaci]